MLLKGRLKGINGDMNHLVMNFLVSKESTFRQISAAKEMDSPSLSPPDTSVKDLLGDGLLRSQKFIVASMSLFVPFQQTL